MLDGEEVALTPKEFDLLALLADDPGAVCSRQHIIEEVWDPHWYGPTKTLDVHIGSLRRKLGDPRWIETVRGVGYRLRDRRAPRGARGPIVRRRLLLSYLSLTLFVLLALALPLGLSFAERRARRVTSQVQTEAFAFALRVDEVLSDARLAARSSVTSRVTFRRQSELGVGRRRCRRHRPRQRGSRRAAGR